jgi:hypothetical protein
MVVEVLRGLKGARGRLQWLIANQGSAGLNYSLLETDSYLQQAIDALSRRCRGASAISEVRRSDKEGKRGSR